LSKTTQSRTTKKKSLLNSEDKFIPLTCENCSAWKALLDIFYPDRDPCKECKKMGWGKDCDTSQDEDNRKIK
jgi:hypothetical protein